MNPLTTTMLGYYRPEYDSFTLSTLMNSYTTALYCCGNSILRDTLRVLQRFLTIKMFAQRFLTIKTLRKCFFRFYYKKTFARRFFTIKTLRKRFFSILL